MKLYVSGFPLDVSEKLIRDLFTPFGTVSYVTLFKAADTGKLIGFCFVEMPNHEEAAQAIKLLSGYNWNGEKLVVVEYQEKLG